MRYARIEVSGVQTPNVKRASTTRQRMCTGEMQSARHHPPKRPGVRTLLKRVNERVTLPAVGAEEAVEIHSPNEVRVEQHQAEQNSHHGQRKGIGRLEPEIAPRRPRRDRPRGERKRRQPSQLVA